MKTFKAVIYDIGIMAATVVSLWLMLSLVVNTVLSCLTMVLETDNVEEMIENIDYSEIISAEMEKSEDVNIQGLDAEVVDEILKTEMVDRRQTQTCIQTSGCMEKVVSTAANRP